MDDHKDTPAAEQALNVLLENTVGELPPSEPITREITPWRRAINRVLVGLAFTCLTLNFFELNYLLPAIGLILMLLGFRSLRRENGHFGAGYILTVVRGFLLFSALILNATILRETVPVIAGIQTALTALGITATFLTILCLWGGFRAVQSKAGLPPHAGSAAALALWDALLIVFARMSAAGLVVWLMLAAYILILRSLFKLSKELDEAGYVIAAAPVRISDRALTIGLTAFLAAGIACGYLFFASYPMSWSAAEPAGQTGAEPDRAALVSLGFPETVLDDLSPQDLDECRNAKRVVVSKDDYAVSEDGPRILRLVCVGVELPGDTPRWKLIHHFEWLKSPGYRGTEAIQFWPACSSERDWRLDGRFTGRVLCERNGTALTAPYYSLGGVTYESSSPFFGAHTKSDVFAEFSLPPGGQDCRGYVSYTVTAGNSDCVIDSWGNYIYQKTPVSYPASIAAKDSANYWNGGPFAVIQNALQFYPGDVNAQPFS